MPRSHELSSLRNLGPASQQWLGAVGLRTRADLERIGAVNAYRLLKGQGYRVTLNMVYAIEGALRDCDWKRLPATLKTRLQAEAQDAVRPRCAWAGYDPLYVRYHDLEWGVPVHDDRLLFEFLILEGAQAGLSWITILRKREAYRQAFDDFDARRIARYDRRRMAALLKNPGIVRNRLKIASTVSNARAFLSVQREFGSFDNYLWRFVGGKPLQARRRSLRDVPARSPESDALSKDLMARGFRFVGSTICYAFMQAVGMVNDHTTDCFRGRALTGVGRSSRKQRN
jgi:DNA-3-methyladenine glycosylase I